MTILGLLIAIVITGVIIWLTERAALPPDKVFFKYIVYVILIVLWLVALAYLFGLVGELNVPIGAGTDVD